MSCFTFTFNWDAAREYIPRKRIVLAATHVEYRYWCQEQGIDYRRHAVPIIGPRDLQHIRGRQLIPEEVVVLQHFFCCNRNVEELIEGIHVRWTPESVDRVYWGRVASNGPMQWSGDYEQGDGFSNADSGSGVLVSDIIDIEEVKRKNTRVLDEEEIGLDPIPPRRQRILTKAAAEKG